MSTLNFVLAQPNNAADRIDEMEARIEALEALIAEELNPNDCVNPVNADLAEEIHKRLDGVK